MNQISTESLLNKESMKQFRTNWTWDQGELLVRKSAKICDQISAKRQNFWFLNSNYLSKSNLNYLNCKDYEGITLLTQLTRRLSFKLLWLLRIYPIPSSSCVRRSRGESKHFLTIFHDLFASIHARLSL